MNIASQVSGPAPLGVTLDLTRDETFPQPPVNGSGKADWCLYPTTFHFGDDAGQHWEHTGESKNRGMDFQEAHVFEQFGTHVITMKMRDDFGAIIGTFAQTITVQDPEVVYLGVTYYADWTNGNDANGGLTPETAFKTSDKLFDTVFASNGPRRGLLKRGETFVTTVVKSYSGRTGSFHIGPYGTGVNPAISKANAGEVLALSAGMVAGARVVDIDLSLSNVTSGFRPGSYCLYLRCGITGASEAFTRSSIHGEATGFVIQECTILGPATMPAGVAHYGMYLQNMFRCALMGNHITLQNTGQSTPHSMRIYDTHCSVKQNLFSGGSDNGDIFSTHGWYDPGLTTHSTATLEYSCHTGNIYDGVNPAVTPGIFDMGPQNVNTDGRIENCLIARNNIKCSPSSTNMLGGSVCWCTFLNNRLNGSPASAVDCLRFLRLGIEPIPRGNRVIHNSMYSSGTVDPVNMLNTSASQSNGSFTLNANDWQLGAGYSWNASIHRIDAAAGSASDLVQLKDDQVKSLIDGVIYSVTAILTNYSGDGVNDKITLKCGSGGAGTPMTGNGTFSELLVCSGSLDIIISKSAGVGFSIDTIVYQVQNQPLDMVFINNHAMTGSGSAFFLASTGTTYTNIGNTRSTTGFVDPAGGIWDPDGTIIGSVDVLAGGLLDFNGYLRGDIGADTDPGSTLFVSGTPADEFAYLDV